jgi:predicted lipid-binding transport protein (Tim44 family)
MKTLLAVLVALVSTSLMIEDAEARRMSGGRNMGMQRSAPAQQQAAPKAPAQQQQAAPATPAQQPQPAGASKWLGPLAGLAIGAGLAAFFFNNGMTGLLTGLLIVGLLAAAAVFAARVLMRGRVAQQPLQYAGAGATERSVAALPGGAGTHSVAATTSGAPLEFDTAGFIRQARLNFVRLQEAHDKKDLSMLRDFLAPDVYREIEADIRAAGEAKHATEVLTLEAEVLDVTEEAGSYIVSVRFSGLMREDTGGDAAPFTEIWHLEKPVAGRGGWLVAGIQQA